MEKLAIGVWIVTGCICAFGMSTHAYRRKQGDFRWFLAGIVFGVLAVPVYCFMVWQKDRAAAAGTAAPQVPGGNASVGETRYAAVADAFLMPGRGQRPANGESGIRPAPTAADPQRDRVA